MNKELEKVKNILHQKSASLVVLKDGEIKEYYNHGVKDLIAILSENKDGLKDAVVADAKIGKVAIALMIKGGVKQAYTKRISKLALSVVNDKIELAYDTIIDFIPNKDNTDMCPMEKKYKDEKDINKIYNDLII